MLQRRASVRAGAPALKSKNRMAAGAPSSHFRCCAWCFASLVHFRPGRSTSPGTSIGSGPVPTWMTSNALRSPQQHFATDQPARSGGPDSDTTTAPVPRPSSATLLLYTHPSSYTTSSSLHRLVTALRSLSSLTLSFISLACADVDTSRHPKSFPRIAYRPRAASPLFTVPNHRPTHLSLPASSYSCSAVHCRDQLLLHPSPYHRHLATVYRRYTACGPSSDPAAVFQRAPKR